MKFSLSVLVTLACVLTLTSAYPDGVPDTVCDSMWPSHKMNDTKLSAQYISPPYLIYTDLVYDIMPGSWVTVTIKATESYFKGFLLQAHWEWSYIWDTENPPKKYGDFLALYNDTQVACNWQAVSHNTAKKYYTATMYWVAPDVLETTGFQFVATIVKDYDIFFMDVRSETIWVKSNIVNGGSASIHTAAAVLAQTIVVVIATILWRM